MTSGEWRLASGEVGQGGKKHNLLQEMQETAKQRCLYYTLEELETLVEKRLREPYTHYAITVIMAMESSC